VTLFFDSDKKMTIGVLSQSPRQQEQRRSHASVEMANYFSNRVRAGSAYQRSPLYFELDGYIRENRTHIRQYMSGRRPDGQWPRSSNTAGTCRGSEEASDRQEEKDTSKDGSTETMISVAMGSLEASDAAQQQELLEQEERLRQQRQCESYDDDDDDDTTFSGRWTDLDRLERVLEIARLVRLNDDLDVLSIYFLRLTSKLCGRVAARVAMHRMQTTRLTLTPFVDGVSLTGYSNFVRHEDHRNNNDDADAETQGPIKLVRHSETGRLIEYRQCRDLALQNYCLGTRQSAPEEIATFTPIQRNDSSCGCEFSWKCEEIALANLHRWWGDIAIRDYMGQKLVLSWNPLSVDAINFQKQHPKNIENNDQDGNSSSNSSDSCPLVTLAAIRLENGPKQGIQTFSPLSPDQLKKHRQENSASSLSMTLNVLKSETRSIDHVTMLYTGHARVEKVQMNFMSLVKAMAKAVAPRVREEQLDILQMRPLLPKEVEYVKMIEEAAAVMQN